MEREPESGIARITINNAQRRNSYDPPMRDQLAAYLDELADDDDTKVVLLRGTGGYFSSGADMRNAYGWYGEGTDQTPHSNGDGSTTGNGKTTRRRRPSQRRRLAVDRRTFAFYHELLGYPKATIAQVEGLALGGGFEIALMADIAVVGENT
ncbi:enoyl-CoA hydratase/isomerase family protein, partial [Parafrankia irregularis]